MLLASLPLLAFFETPVVAGLAALGAASIPVVIHLLNRRRFRIVEWAAMRFLLLAQKKNTRRMRLEQLLLLAVRTLLVLLLVLAMISVTPWSERLWYHLFPESAVRAAAGGRRMHKILVLDGSFSMAQKIGDRSCFDQAKTVANQILQESSAGDGFSVILAAAPARRIVGEPSDDPRRVADEIDRLRLPLGNADVSGTLTALDEMLRTSPAKYEERVVYILTDLQRATWSNPEPGDRAALWKRLQGRGQFVMVDLGRDDLTNSAVTQVSLGVPIVLTGAATPISAVVRQYGPPRKQARVQLLVGKARQTASEPPFGLRVVDQRIMDLVLGQNQVGFSYKFAAPGDYAVQVRLDADALEPDDSRTVLVTVKDDVPVMLVNGKPAPDLYERATEWLSDALNPFQGSLSPRNVPARPRTVSEAQFADAALGDLSGYDCVFLCDVARLGTGEVRRLEAHLERGGGVVFCLGPRVDLEAYNRIVYRNGEGILPARLLAVQPALERDTFHLSGDDKSFRESPLDAFASERDRASLLGARFRQYVRTEPPAKGRARKILSFVPETDVSPGRPTPAALGRPAGSGSVPSGDAALVEWSKRRGRVLLFTSTVNMDWTTWPGSPSFPALVQEMMLYAVAGRLREQSLLVGDVLEQVASSSSSGLEMTVTSPDGRSETVRSEHHDDASRFRYVGTDQSGIFKATIGQNPQEVLFAVNVPANTDTQDGSESDPSRINASELKDTYKDAGIQVVTDFHKAVLAASPSGEGAPGEDLHGMGIVIARWLTILVLVLVVLEIVLAWHFGHYTGVVDATTSPPAPGKLLPLAAALVFFLLFVGLAATLIHAVRTGDLLSFLPDETRSSLEARLDIPQPAAGEGNTWRLEFLPFLVDGATDPWIAGAWAVTMLVLVGIIYWREGKTASKPYKILLGGLKLFFILLTLVVFLPQLKVQFERQGWPDVVILLDDSRSMSTLDTYQNSPQREAAEQLAKAGAQGQLDRLQMAQTILTKNNHAWLSTLLGQRRVKVHIDSVSKEQVSGPLVANEASQLDGVATSIQGWHATAERSPLGTAVRRNLTKYRGSSLAAIITFTDGINTEGEDLVKAARYASQMGVPLFFIGLGNAQEVRDLKLHDLAVEDSVYVNDRLVFEARLTGQGYTMARTVTATLSEKDPTTGRLKQVAQERVTTDPSGKPVRFRITHQPSKPGEITYVVSVPEQEDEVKPADNNRVERKVFVRDSKIIRVLYVEGYPRYEYRFIKTLLERESEKEKGNKTIDMRVLLLDADPEYAGEDRSAIVDFPTREELNAYDVILWGDVDPHDRRIGDRNLQNLANFVKERGGGLLMIAGPRNFNPFACKDTPLREVMPIQVVAAPLADESRPQGSFRPELTPIGRFHPIFRFRPEESENQAVWNSLPEMFWWSEGYRPQPAAEVLMVQPRRPAPEPRRPGDTDRQPLLVQQFVGAGRTMFLGIDETWAWRFRENELYFNEFWIQMIRHLARNRQGRIDLHFDRETPYRSGEAIRLTVRFPDDTPAPASDTRVEVVMTRTQPAASGRTDAPRETEKETLRLAKVPGSRATYETLLTRTPEGQYRFWLSSPSVPDPKPRAEARVLPPPGEMDMVRMNQPDMERAAEETHGRFYSFADADRLLGELPSGSRLAMKAKDKPLILWNQAGFYFLALGLLGTEWVLRKRKHLL